MTLPPLPKLPYKMYAPSDAELLMQEYGLACRAAALEEAAKVCDDHAAQFIGNRIRSNTATDCAAAIRALKEGA